MSTIAPNVCSRSWPGRRLPGEHVVGDGADRERADAVLGGEGVQRARLHLDREHAVLDHRLHQLLARAVELVTGEDQPDVGGDVGPCPRRVVRRHQQAEVGDRRVVEAMEPQPVHRRVGAGAGRDHDVAERQLVGHRAAGTYPDRGAHVVLPEQLVGVDRERRLAHAGPLHRDRPSLPGAGVAEHARARLSSRWSCRGTSRRSISRGAGRRAAGRWGRSRRARRRCGCSRAAT